MVRPVSKIVIVGGGTAGWLAAGVIAAKHRNRMPAGFSVTLVESPNTPIIGVGEGTWPTLRTTLSRIGVSETELFRQCDAAFKQGALFARWTTGASNDAYYHPLMLPQGFSHINLVPHWLASGTGMSFCDAVCPQGRICDDGLAPKTIATAEFEAVANYAYHLDAGKFAPFLQKHCCDKLGVRHVLADVRRVNLTEDGDIRSLETEQAGEIEGDLFIDCTGFKALLIGETLGVPFKECSDVLFCDTALAVQVPYESETSPIASHTISTAQSAGWIWDIGLPTRRGIGHVFSSRHISVDEAERELRAYIGPRGKDLPVRRIPIRAGHREIVWKRNCVAIGLSAGFLEPLEASAIVLVEMSAKLIAEQMPVCREVMDVLAARFNSTTQYRWGRIIDFLKLHYVLTQREDTAFWRDNCLPETIPERLQNLLLLWKYQSPWYHDEFDRIEEVFPAASYQYVLYGMGFRTEVEPQIVSGNAKGAERAMRDNLANTEKLRTALPRHRELIRKVVEVGLQPVSRTITMSKLEPLNPQDHGRLRLRPRVGLEPHFVQIVPMEFPAAAACCPILFSKDAASGAFYAGAMLGFKPAEGALKNITERGGFEPLNLQRDGFFTAEEQIVIDRDNPRFSETEGEPLFDESQQPSVCLRKIQRVLGRLHEGNQQSEAFIRNLLGLKLVEPMDITLSFDDGERLTLQGLYTISKDALRELNDGNVLRMFRTGHLQLACTVAGSINQLAMLAGFRNRRITGM